MKTNLLFCVVISALIISFFSDFSSAQGYYWDRTKRITSGFVDKNPSFDTKRPNSYGLGGFSFLVFERWSSPTASNICVMKFGYDSAFSSSVQYITNNSLQNKNPKISYKTQSGYGGTLTNAMIVWEVFENSRSNIYGSTFNNNVWSAPYPIDTSAGNKTNPCVSYNSALSSNNLYSIVYEKNGDIIYKNFESNLLATWNEFNLTSAETELCRNPKVASPTGGPMPHFVTYEKQKPNGDFGIWYKKATTAYIWGGDTLCTIGNNKNPNIQCSMNTIYSVSYESNRTGKWGLYATDYNIYGGTSQSNTIIQSPAFNYRNAMNVVFPVITDYSGVINCYVRQTPVATKIMTSGPGFIYFTDSITVGDSSSKTVMNLGNGVLHPNYSSYMVWMVFDKDSAGFSTLNARGKIILVGGINRIGTTVPDKYSLSQNYPNPFNPVTKIMFSNPSSTLSSPHGVGGDLVQLKIYDITGREVQTLVNETLAPGTYETSFDGSMLNSGIYFYKLITNGYTETKKMLLIK